MATSRPNSHGSAPIGAKSEKTTITPVIAQSSEM